MPFLFSRKFLASFILLTPLQLLASSECADLQDIQEIKSYIQCSTNTDMNGCDDLFAAATVGGVTKAFYKKDQSGPIKESIEKSLKERIEKVYLFNRYEKVKAKYPATQPKNPQQTSGFAYLKKITTSDSSIQFLATDEEKYDRILNSTDAELEEKLNDLKRKSVTNLSPTRDDQGGIFGRQIQQLKAIIKERESLTPEKRQAMTRRYEQIKEQRAAFSRFMHQVQSSKSYSAGKFNTPQNLKYVEGEWIDLNNTKLFGYSSLDEKFKKEAKTFADDFLKQSEAAHLIYGSKENAVTLNQLKPKNFKDEMNILDKIEVNPERMRKQIVAALKIDNPGLFDKTFSKLATKTNPSFSFEKLVQQAHQKVSLTTAAIKVAEKVSANPLIGAVVMMASSIDVTACSTTDMPYVNRNPQNNCRADFALNTNVAKFLDLPATEQKKLLADPGVCRYYKELWEDLLSVPQIKGIKCNDQGSTAKIETIDRYNKKNIIAFDQSDSSQNIKTYEYEFQISQSGELKSYSYFPQSYGGSTVKKFQRNQTDFDQNAQSEEDQKAQTFFRKAKLYIPQIAECCSQKSLSPKCKEQFNFQGESTISNPQDSNPKSTPVNENQ